MNPRNPQSVILFACGAAAIAATVAMAGETRYIFLATGLWAMAVVFFPIALAGKSYDWFSVWSFVGLTVVVGITIRGACLTFGYPDEDRLDELFFLGRAPAYFVQPAVMLLSGLLMLALGYVARTPGARPVVSGWDPDLRRARVICLALLVVSALATVLYVGRTGCWESGDWSGKRTPIPGPDLAGTGYQSHGGLRFLASLAVFGNVLAMACRMRGLAIALLAVGCIVPFYASLRTNVALQLCLPVAMIYYSGRRGVFVPIVAAAIFLPIAIHVMTILRPLDAEPVAPTVMRVFDSAVLNRNQIDLPKTAHIVSAVPVELPLAYGQTVANWAIAPIPRSLWPDKPVIPPGPVIGRAIYDQPIAGVPPSLVAELFWNFHWPGVLIGSFGFGMALRWVQARFQAVRSSDPFRAALYVAGPMTIGFESVGSSIGSGVFQAVLHTATMLAILFLAQDLRNKGVVSP